MDTEGLGLLEDIELGALDKRTWNIHFYQPWVRPALPRSDWDTIENMIKIYLQKFSHLINDGASERDVPCEYLAFSASPLQTGVQEVGKDPVLCPRH